MTWLGFGIYCSLSLDSGISSKICTNFILFFIIVFSNLEEMDLALIGRFCANILKMRYLIEDFAFSGKPLRNHALNKINYEYILKRDYGGKF